MSSIARCRSRLLLPSCVLKLNVLLRKPRLWLTVMWTKQLLEFCWTVWTHGYPNPNVFKNIIEVAIKYVSCGYRRVLLKYSNRTYTCTKNQINEVLLYVIGFMKKYTFDILTNKMLLWSTCFNDQVTFYVKM